MTPEDMDFLRRLKQLLDDGVLTAEEFELQKSDLFSTSSRPVRETQPSFDDERDSSSPSLLMKMGIPSSPSMLTIGVDKGTYGVVQAAQRAAIRVQILAFIVAFAGIIFGIILMTYRDEYAEIERPFLETGIGVAANAPVLAIVLYAIGKYMEARLKQGSDTASKVERN